MEKHRPYIFAVVLVALYVPPLLIMLQFSDLGLVSKYSMGDLVLVAIVNSAPLIITDASLFGELSPFAIAGLLTVLAPKKDEKVFIIAAILLCAFGWLIYIVFSALLADGTEFSRAVVVYLDGNVHSETIEEGVISIEPGIGTIQAVATGSRVFYLVVAASLIGVSIRKER